MDPGNHPPFFFRKSRKNGGDPEQACSYLTREDRPSRYGGLPPRTLPKPGVHAHDRRRLPCQAAALPLLLLPSFCCVTIVLPAFEGDPATVDPSVPPQLRPRNERR